MKNALAVVQVLCYIFYVFHTTYVKADIPVHVEIHHLVGTWEILPTETSTVISNCGSSYPNNNVDNVKISDYKQFLIQNKFKFDDPIKIRLSDDYVLYGDLYDTKNNEHRKNWKILAVYNEDGKVIGSWTTIYNEGIEIKIGKSTYTALMHYEPNGNCKDISNEDSLDSNGETECYTTSYNKIRFGWFDKYSISREADIVYGCFYAEKIKEDSETESKSHSFVHHQQKHKVYKNSKKGKENNLRNDSENSTFEFLEEMLELTETSEEDLYKKHYSQKSPDSTSYPENSELNWHKQKHHGKKKKLSDEVLTHNSKQKYACPCNAAEDVQNLVHKEESLNVVSNSMIQLENSLSTSHRSKQIISSIIDDSDSTDAASNKLDLETYETTTKKQHEELDIKDLPREFTWGDPYNNNAREYEVLNQLKCGSCYIASLLYTFKRRIEIGLTKRLGKEFLQDFDDNLSIQSVLSCSFYDQGCHGGYPFLVAKQGQLQGIPLDRCMPYTANEEKCALPIRHSFSQLNTSENVLKNIREVRMNTTEDSSNENKGFASLFSFIDKEKFCDASNRWFIKNYGYIGGCYGCNQCNGEKIMMNEIFQNGPIVASFEASPGIYSYVDGVYYEENYPHAKRCSIKKKKFTDFNVTGWEKVNHAIVLVGWGEEPLGNGKFMKYWIARNSWGVHWGKHGYFKIIRGINFNGIESQNVFADPDFTRGAGKKIMEILSHKE